MNVYKISTKILFSLNYLQILYVYKDTLARLFQAVQKSLICRQHRVQKAKRSISSVHPAKKSKPLLLFSLYKNSQLKILHLPLWIRWRQMSE